MASDLGGVARQVHQWGNLRQKKTSTSLGFDHPDSFPSATPTVALYQHTFLLHHSNLSMDSDAEQPMTPAQKRAMTRALNKARQQQEAVHISSQDKGSSCLLLRRLAQLLICC